LRALKSANPTLVRKLAGSGKLEAHLSAVRQRATRMHKQLEHGWKRLNPYNARVHRSETDHDKLAAREVEEMVLAAILPPGTRD
jgi:hypothetical protein